MLHKLKSQIFTTETAQILLKVMTFLVLIIADHLIEKYKLGFSFLRKYYIFLLLHSPNCRLLGQKSERTSKLCNTTNVTIYY